MKEKIDIKSNMNLTTITYDKKYFPQIVELWSEQYGSLSIEKRKKLFDWIISDNPFVDDDNPYYVLLDDEKVIGMHGMMPLWFLFGGTMQRGYFAHDILLSKDYRGKGLGKVILNQMMENVNSFAGALWFNEPNYHLYKKNGWLDIPDLYAFVKVNKPEYFLSGIVNNRILRKLIAKPVIIYLRLRDAIIAPHSDVSIKIFEVQVFDNSIDTLVVKAASHYGIMTLRNHQYLNWKFDKKPFNKYKKFIAYDENGELSGYIVMKTEDIKNGKRGRIMDFLADPEKPEIFKGMLMYCCKELNKDDVDYVQLITSSPELSAIIAKCGFIKARKPVRFMVKNWEKIFDKSFVIDKNNWYITESDGDGDSWSID